MRLAQCQGHVAGQEGQGIAGKLVAGPAVELEVARRSRNVGEALLQWLAGVAGFKSAEVIEIVEDRLAELRQKPPALVRRHCPPGAFEGGARRDNGCVDFGRTGARDGGEGFAVGGAEHVDDAPVGGLRGAPADDVAVGFKRVPEVFCRRHRPFLPSCRFLDRPAE